mgnify:CR=1 FL=1
MRAERMETVSSRPAEAFAGFTLRVLARRLFDLADGDHIEEEWPRRAREVATDQSGSNGVCLHEYAPFGVIGVITPVTHVITPSGMSTVTPFRLLPRALTMRRQRPSCTGVRIWGMAMPRWPDSHSRWRQNHSAWGRS